MDGDITTNISKRQTGAATKIKRMKLRNPTLSNSEIARRVGCDKSNVFRVLQRFLGDHSEDELRDFQQAKADIFDALQLRYLMSITDAKIKKTSLLQLQTAAAIAFDKGQLERGRSTQNVAVLVEAATALRERQEREA